MLGPHHLNEVFFDGVWAGPEDVLGQVNDGWRVVRETLAFERVGSPAMPAANDFFWRRRGAR